MCLIGLAIGQHPDYPVILVGNRDEFRGRPSRPLHAWSEHRGIIGGRDLSAGGTWMASRGRHFAAVTNVRRPTRNDAHKRSRGQLPLDYLRSQLQADTFFSTWESWGRAYGGGNLLCGELQADGAVHAHWASNDPVQDGHLDAGIHLLSNAAMNTPWPKAERLRADIAKAVSAPRIDHTQLLNALLHKQYAPADQLPDTGIDQELEAKLSAAFVDLPEYGTVSTTLILMNTEHSLIHEYLHGHQAPCQQHRTIVLRH